ncbi:IopA [Streptomyces sp. 4N509B]|uniref:IopA n=1 Tax=Streptomyces sp. 4N509B TaxID=3457413 RepID=UPI003FD4D49B
MDQQTESIAQIKSYEKTYEDFVTQGGDIRWLPYVMFFNHPDYQSDVVNTDAGGFRVAHGPAGPVSLRGTLPADPVSVVLGASPAFGFGASCDEQTVPSLLASATGQPWLNMAGPALNSTQETVLFLLHRHQLPAVRDIVVFSGLNNLVVAGLPLATHDYGQFFYSDSFHRQLGIAPGEEQPTWALGRLARAAKRLGRGSGEREENEARVLTPAERVEMALTTTARDLDRLVELAAPTGARIHFVLQPTIAWTGKTFTPEEDALINHGDPEHAILWNLFTQILDPQIHATYASGLAEACAKRTIPFLDMSSALAASPAASSWLFVDHVHLTDHGSRTVADLMNSQLDLATPR